MTTFNEQDSKVNGRWTKVEHDNFLKGLELYGRNWKKIQELVGTRNGSQIRSHAQKFFLKVKKTFDTTENEQACKESFSEPESSKLFSRKNTIGEEENIQHSFFMGEIIKMTNYQPEFNFWEMFIDMGDSKNQVEHTLVSSRKDSFVAHDLTQSKQETPIDCLVNPL